jgi:hypothetical protein
LRLNTQSFLFFGIAPIKLLVNSGAGQGVVLAFIITGKATGVPVIAGM